MQLHSNNTINTSLHSDSNGPWWLNHLFLLLFSIESVIGFINPMWSFMVCSCLSETSTDWPAYRRQMFSTVPFKSTAVFLLMKTFGALFIGIYSFISLSVQSQFARSACFRKMQFLYSNSFSSFSYVTVRYMIQYRVLNILRLWRMFSREASSRFIVAIVLEIEIKS